MIKQGKVKAIPVKEVTEGMQVWFPTYPTGKSTFIIGKCGENYIELKNDDRIIDIIHITSIDKLKTFVVEYEDYSRSLRSMVTLGLPLKYSQWQSAIDNGEVDSDKIIEFEISTKGNERDGNSQPNHQYAKIISQKSNTDTYTRNEVLNILKKFAMYVDADKVETPSVYRHLVKGWFEENVK